MGIVDLGWVGLGWVDFGYSGWIKLSRLPFAAPFEGGTVSRPTQAGVGIVLALIWPGSMSLMTANSALARRSCQLSVLFAYTLDLPIQHLHASSVCCSHVHLQVFAAPTAATWALEFLAQSGSGAVQLLQELGLCIGVRVPAVLSRYAHKHSVSNHRGGCWSLLGGPSRHILGLLTSGLTNTTIVPLFSAVRLASLPSLRYVCVHYVSHHSFFSSAVQDFRLSQSLRP